MGKRIDLTGQRFGRLVVLEYVEIRNHRAYWKCKCDCGKIVIKCGKNLKNGDTKSCGCYWQERISKTRRIEMPIGTRFGRLTIVKYSHKNKDGELFWLCLCDCKNTKAIRGKSLRNGDTKSCGCYSREIRKIANIGRIAPTRLPKGVACFNKLFRAYKQNAKNRGHSFEITKEEFKNLVQQNCYYCDIKPSQISSAKDMYGTYTYNGIDRVDSSKGYVPGNVVTCCVTCNRMKLDHTVKRFLEHVTKIVEHQKNKV